MNEHSNAGMPPVQFIENRAAYSGFRQFNLGHLITILVTVFSFGVTYQNITNRLENQQGQIIALQNTQNRLGDTLASVQIEQATDRDFSRRISNLEEKQERGK